MLARDSLPLAAYLSAASSWQQVLKAGIASRGAATVGLASSVPGGRLRARHSNVNEYASIVRPTWLPKMNGHTQQQHVLNVHQHGGAASYLNTGNAQKDQSHRNIVGKLRPTTQRTSVYEPTRRFYATVRRVDSAHQHGRGKRSQGPHVDRVYVESMPAGKVLLELASIPKAGAGGTDPQPVGEISNQDVANGEITAPITIKDIVSNVKDAPRISHVEDVSSYSLTSAENPTIAVPGMPPFWAPPTVPTTVPADSDQVFSDCNAAHNSVYPMASCVTSVLALSPNLDTSGIDVVACEDTLAMLWRFLSNRVANCRFTVQLVGNTLFLVRNEGKRIYPGLKGFGHGFLKECTRMPEEVSETISHHHVVAYDFAGMRLMVRFECDAYYASSEDATPSEPAKIISQKRSSDASPESTTPEGASPRMDALPEPTPTQSSPIVVDAKISEAAAEANLSIQPLGTWVPLSTIVEIKTRSILRIYNHDDRFMLMWLRRMQNLVVAYHKKGDFTNIDKLSLRDEIPAWEAGNADGIRNLGAILSWFKGTAKEMMNADGKGKFEVYCVGHGPLQIREIAEDTEVLPEGLKELWLSKREKVDE